MPLAPSLPPGTPMAAPDLFAGRIAVVTGAGDAVGQAIAVELARAGASLVLMDGSLEACDAAVAAVGAVAGVAKAMAVALTDEAAVARAFDEIEGAMGPVTLLVNNARTEPDEPVELMDPQRWRRVTHGVIDGTFNVVREMGLRRIADGAGGAIVNTGTPYVDTGGAGRADITAAKAAVMNLTKSLAVEWAPYDIRVNGIAAGYVAGAEAGPVAEEDLAPTVPAGRLCQPHEIAWCVVYMCSPFAAYLTGATMVVDGASWQRPGRTPPRFEPIRDRYGKALGKP